MSSSIIDFDGRTLLFMPSLKVRWGDIFDPVFPYTPCSPRRPNEVVPYRDDSRGRGWHRGFG